MAEPTIKNAAQLQPGDFIAVGPYGGMVRVSEVRTMTDDECNTVIFVNVPGVGAFELPPFMAVVVDG